MKRRRLAAIFTSILLGLGIGVVAVQPADAAVFVFAVSSNSRGIWAYSGYNGGGHADYVPPNGEAELAWVSSFRIPARCRGYMGGIPIWGKKSYSRYANIYPYIPGETFAVKC